MFYMFSVFFWYVDIVVMFCLMEYGDDLVLLFDGVIVVIVDGCFFEIL